jgi:hypothetical protein
MSRARLVAITTAVITGLTAIQAPAAPGDGLPILGIGDSRTGVTDGAGARYVTFSAGRNSVLARISMDDGRIEASRTLPSRLTMPVVGYDGSTSGISADGETLVLIRPRVSFPQGQTRLAVFDTERLRPERSITLRRDFSFDAISPDGRLLYLIHYLSPRDLTRYEVRAFDLDAERLLPGPIVDPSEPDEDMRGMPVTREMSPDGRWAYTLYDGIGHEPFIHALDTEGRRAVCIDLPQLEGSPLQPGRIRLDVGSGGRELTVVNHRDRALLVVDTESFEVGKPGNPDTATGSNGSDSGPAWVLIAAAIVGFALALIAGGGLVRGGRRDRTGSRPEPEMPADPEVRQPAIRD